MKLLEQILSELGADSLKSITLVPDNCCYLRSVKSVVEFSPTKMVLAVGKKRVTLEGENMTVGQFFEGDLCVKGEIRGIRID